LAERYALAQETAKLEAELSNYSGSEELLGALRDLASRRAARTDATAKAWQTIVVARRTADARIAEQTSSAAAADAAAQNRPTLLLQIAQASEVLSKKRTAIAEELAKTANAITNTEDRQSALDADLKDITQRISVVGLTDAMGALLRERRASLPVPRKIRQ